MFANSRSLVSSLFFFLLFTLPTVVVAETTLWSQEFNENTIGLQNLPSGVGAIDGKLNLTSDYADKVHIEHIYASATKPTFHMEFVLPEANASSNDEIAFGIDNLALDREHALVFKGSDVYAKRNNGITQEVQFLGTIQLNLAYQLEIQVSSAGSTTLRVYAAGTNPQNGYQDILSNTTWGDVRGFIELINNDSGAASIQIDSIAESVADEMLPVLWQQNFNIDTLGLEFSDSIIPNVTHINGALHVQTSDGFSGWDQQALGRQIYAWETGVQFRAEITPRSWAASGLITLGVRGDSTGHAHHALFTVDGVFAEYATDGCGGGCYTYDYLGPVDLDTTYMVDVQTGGSASILSIYPLGSSPAEGYQHVYQQTGWKNVRSAITMYSPWFGPVAKAEIDNLQERMGGASTPMPIVSILAPLPATYVKDARPTISLTYNSSVGIDTHSIQLTKDDQALPVTCSATSQLADCVPDAPLDEGFVSIDASVADTQGNRSVASSTAFTVDTVSPSVVINEPVDGTFFSNTNIVLSGTISESAESVLFTHNANLQSIVADVSNNFSENIILVEGGNQLVVTATDYAGNAGSESRNVVLDTQAPAAPVESLITIGLPIDGVIVIEGQPSSVEANATIIITNNRTGESITVTANADGSFSAAFNGEVGDTFTITAADAAGNISTATAIESGTSLPADPALYSACVIKHWIYAIR